MRKQRKTFWEKKSKYGLYSLYMEIETWETWKLYSIRERNTGVVIDLRNEKTNKRKSILLEKLSKHFKPLLRRYG